MTVSGESGAGKSELAYEIYRLSERAGIRTEVLQQDDYFVFPPRTNHEMRRDNLEQVGPYEVKLDFLDSNLRSFKRGESPIYKPLVVYEEDRITCEELDVADLAVLVAEGTYTSLLRIRRRSGVHRPRLPPDPGGAQATGQGQVGAVHPGCAGAGASGSSASTSRWPTSSSRTFRRHPTAGGEHRCPALPGQGAPRTEA